jgi:hypothetical protein
MSASVGAKSDTNARLAQWGRLPESQAMQFHDHGLGRRSLGRNAGI